MKYIIRLLLLALAIYAVWYIVGKIKTKLPIEPTYTTEKYEPTTETEPKEWPCEPGWKCN